MSEVKENTIVGVVGLGYVGIPLAISFSKKYEVIGFDTNKEKIEKYRNGIDVTKEIGNNVIKSSNIKFTSDEKILERCDFIIIAVPTPIDEENKPDVKPLELASGIVGKNLKRNAIVIYESTVYPGLTEEVCLPILEKYSNMKCGRDFKIAYSPERINPGDKVNTFETITKIVSGMDEQTLDKVAELYSSVLKNGVYKASSIKVAEAAKVIENTQRDINIAFMNELSKIFHTMDIDTKEVIDAASSKWNFLKFTPGLVGGHCIGVDPFYLIEKSIDMGYQPNLLIESRNVNDSMGKYIADNVIKYLISKKNNVKKSTVLVYGITFKPNVNDIRNSKVIDIINNLNDFGVKVIVTDNHVDENEVKSAYNIEINNNYSGKVDIIIFAVDHEEYKSIKINELNDYFKNDKCIFDIKNIFNKKELLENDFFYWSL